MTLAKLPDNLQRSKKEISVVSFQRKPFETVNIVNRKPNQTMKKSEIDEKLEHDNSEQSKTRARIANVTKTFLGAIMPQIMESTSTAASTIWALFYSVFIFMLFLQTYNSVKDYFSRPVTVGIIIDSTKPSLEFPAVTICNNNIVRKNFIKRIPRFEELASLTELVYHTLAPETLRDVTDMENLGFYLCYPETTDWIPASWMCNGRKDCSDGSDELSINCERFTSLNYTDSCLEGFLQCPQESTCAVKCDGIEECTVVPGYDESLALGCASIIGETFLEAFTSMERTLTSPNFPENYMNNMDKSYIIQAPQGHVIRIKFNYFYVEGLNVSSKCKSDYMTIQDGISNQEMFFLFDNSAGMCGYMCNIDDIVSTVDKIKIKFVTDGKVTQAGWSLNYSAVPANISNKFPSGRSRYKVNHFTSCKKTETENFPLGRKTGRVAIFDKYIVTETPGKISDEFFTEKKITPQPSSSFEFFLVQFINIANCDAK